MDWAALMNYINLVALLCFVLCIGAGIFGMVRRVILFQRAEERVPVILRRDLGLFVALSVIGLESLGIRALGINLAEMPDLVRLLFAVHWDIILISALLYWVKVELWDVDDPDKP